MDGLFKRVLKGVYPKIPTNYTDDLAKMIKKLITVNPNQRPTCDQILQIDIVQKWMKKLGISNNEYQSQVSIHEEDDGLGGNLTLLNTIKLPKNLKLLSDRLPKSKYEEENHDVRSLLNEVSSTKSLKTSPDTNKDQTSIIRTGGRKAHPGNNNQ